MTRITNFGRKRTYVEAGFQHGEASSLIKPALPPTDSPQGDPCSPTEGVIDTSAQAPPKKKRKRTPKSKRNGITVVQEKEGNDTGVKERKDTESGKHLLVPVSGGSEPLAKATTRKKERRNSLVLADRAKKAESRRQKRIAQRQVDTTCFACRQKGHSAANCSLATRNDTDIMNTGILGGKIVGICYRCGSTRHTLARCKKSVDASSPLPFASCFVCSGKGHLASSCPQNKAKGIYPNGGHCKLCGETTHLAKNCGLMKNDPTPNNQVMFSRSHIHEAGADEDDFHTFKRRKAEVEKDEKGEDKVKRLADIKAGVHSGIVKAFGKPVVTSTKKIVTF